MKRPFNYSTYPWRKTVNYRRKPHLYRVGKGEQGVLICEPYKSEILPFWKFKTPSLATVSAKQIYQLFLYYLKKNDFVGADMARKYLQMGYTRSRRYANYQGGRKYDEDGRLKEKGTGQESKAIAASIFFKAWKKAEKNVKYMKMKAAWKKRLG